MQYCAMTHDPQRSCPSKVVSKRSKPDERRKAKTGKILLEGQGGKNRWPTCSLQYVRSDSKISLDSFHCNYFPVRQINGAAAKYKGGDERQDWREKNLTLLKGTYCSLATFAKSSRDESACVREYTGRDNSSSNLLWTSILMQSNQSELFLGLRT